MKNTRCLQHMAWSVLLASCMAATAAPAPSLPEVAKAASAWHELDGVRIDDTVNVRGATLVLNGAGTQKRGFFKTNTCALYLPEKRGSFAGVLAAEGPKRLQIVALRDIAGWLISRQFVADFAANTTDDEAQKLAPIVDAVAADYAKMGVLHKGDTMVVDWIPGQGIVSTVNGKSMGPPLNNALFFEVSLRPLMGKQAPADLREQLLDQPH